MKIPKVGDTIYVPSALYLGHGRDDFCGGKAVVSRVGEWTNGVVFVSVWPRPSAEYNWESLSKEQKKLKEQYKNTIAHPDPDYSPEFNDW